jgi:hypothetical protein
MPRIRVMFALFGIWAFAVVGTKAAQTAPQSWGDVVNGLQMSISPDQNAKGPMQFQVEFRNVGQAPLVIATGGGCGKLAGEVTSHIIIIHDRFPGA